MRRIKHTTTPSPEWQTTPASLPGLGTHVALLKALQTHTAGAGHAHSLLSLPFVGADLEGWLCVQPRALPAPDALPTQERLQFGYGTAGTDKTAVLSPQSPLFLPESLCDQPVSIICLFWL